MDSCIDQVISGNLKSMQAIIKGKRHVCHAPLSAVEYQAPQIHAATDCRISSDDLEIVEDERAGKRVAVRGHAYEQHDDDMQYPPGCA